MPLDQCTINLESGNPYLFEDYWVRHPQPALTMQPSAHLGYGVAYGHLPRLVSAIQNLHAMVGPAASSCSDHIVARGPPDLLKTTPLVTPTWPDPKGQPARQGMHCSVPAWIQEGRT